MTTQNKSVQVHEGQGEEPKHFIKVIVRERGDEYEPHYLSIEWKTLCSLRYCTAVGITQSRTVLTCEADGFEWVGIRSTIVQDSDKHIVILVDQMKLGTMA